MHSSLLSTLSKYNAIILVGGWTGWHIQPIVSLVKSLKKELNLRSEDLRLILEASEKPIHHTPLSPGGQQFLWIWWSDSQEERIAKEEHIRFISIPTLKLATTRSFKILLYPFILLVGFWKTRKIFTNLPIYQSTNLPICIFSKWWPGSVAIGIAAWSLWIPLYIHESDTIPGKSNRILGKFATKIFLGFEWAKKYFNSSKCEVVGQILDPVFEWGVPDIQYKVQWKTSKPHILVICGSQWSRAIFEWIIDQFSSNEEYEWIIALGKLNSIMKSEFDTISDCQALEWISQSDIAHLVKDTNIAITRWSATTLAELTSFSESDTKLIIIPLPYSAGNHQYYNALEYEKMGHTLLEQQYLTNLHNTISNLTKHAWNKPKNQ
jgi:UDP-N-acetylglucosamine--N-acetylmuramyl-(pentapeptide) pyrophosphoryl-undecaprenol N-acetylglucosamine transferase